MDNKIEVFKNEQFGGNEQPSIEKRAVVCGGRCCKGLWRSATRHKAFHGWMRGYNEITLISNEG